MESYFDSSRLGIDLLLAFLTLTPSGRLLLPEVLPATDTVSHEAEVNDILDYPSYNPDDDSESLLFAMSKFTLFTSVNSHVAFGNYYENLKICTKVCKSIIS